MFNRETIEFLISTEHLINLGIAIGVFFLFLLFRKLFTKYIFKLILRSINKTKLYFLSTVFQSFQRPVEWLFIVLGIYLAFSYYPYFNHEQEWFLRLINVSVIILVAWGLYKLSSGSSALFRKINEKANLEIDDVLIPLLSKTLQFIIVAIAATVVLQEFGYNIEAFIAGLGLGGLAISLAAKDALSNIFGGVVIISEKPFKTGDWILTPSVEGVVEDISFRSTRLRTFADALLTVPNSTLANESITNWSEMGKRQITFNLRVVYGTPREKVKRTVERITNLLKEHDEIHQETIFVNFDQFKEDGMDIFLYFFTKTTDWGEFLQIREEINLKILEILEEEKVEIAVPLRRLQVEQDTEMIEQKVREN